MNIHVKIIFNSRENKIESFGNWRYLVYMKMPAEDPNAMPFFVEMMSRHLGTEPKHFRYLGKHNGEHVFET